MERGRFFEDEVVLRKRGPLLFVFAVLFVALGTLWLSAGLSPPLALSAFAAPLFLGWVGWTQSPSSRRASRARASRAAEDADDEALASALDGVKTDPILRATR